MSRHRIPASLPIEPQACESRLPAREFSSGFVPRTPQSTHSSTRWRSRALLAVSSLVGLPVRAVTAKCRVVHLVSVVLSELDIQSIRPQAENVGAVLA